MIARLPIRGALRAITLSTTFIALAAQAPAAAQRAPARDSVIALVGATLIDGNGGPAVPDATILVRGNRIAQVGPRASVTVPRGPRVINAAGKFATPVGNLKFTFGLVVGMRSCGMNSSRAKRVQPMLSRGPDGNSSSGIARHSSV